MNYFKLLSWFLIIWVLLHSYVWFAKIRPELEQALIRMMDKTWLFDKKIHVFLNCFYIEKSIYCHLAKSEILILFNWTTTNIQSSFAAAAVVGGLIDQSLTALCRGLELNSVPRLTYSLTESLPMIQKMMIIQRQLAHTIQVIVSTKLDFITCLKKAWLV